MPRCYHDLPSKNLRQVLRFGSLPQKIILLDSPCLVDEWKLLLHRRSKFRIVGMFHNIQNDWVKTGCHLHNFPVITIFIGSIYHSQIRGWLYPHVDPPVDPPLSPNGSISQAPKATETPRRFDALRTRPHLNTLHTSFWRPKNHPLNRQKNIEKPCSQRPDFPNSAASHLDPLNSMPTQPSWGLWGPTLGVVRMLVVGCFWCHDINSNPRQIEK